MAPETLEENNQIELPMVKIEPKEEVPVEIGIDDIYNSSDEEKCSINPNLDPKEIVPLSNLAHTSEKNLGEVLKSDDKDGSEEDGEHFNAASNLQTGEQLVLNFSKGHEPSRPRRKNDMNPVEINWANAFRTRESTNVKEEIKKVTKMHVPVSAIEPHEITTLDSTTHICNHCQLKFGDIRRLRLHIRRLHREVTDIYQCPYCPYKSKWTIGSHILLKHVKEKEVNWYKCHLCDMRCKLKTNLTRHIRTHLSRVQLADTMKQCSTCEKQFKTGSALKAHIKFVHNKERNVPKRLQCKECDYRATGTNNLKHHIEVHHTKAKDRRTYECDKCDFKTKFLKKFYVHSKKHQKGIVCEKCGFVGSSDFSLSLHRITHEEKIDERHLKYRCDKCDYKTYRQYSLNIHKLNHLKPKEICYFYCYHCDFKAKRKDNLKTHVLRHFKREEVTLQCFICDFKTNKRQNLINHVNKHSRTQTKKQAG